MGADVLATQGAKASATMILTMLNRISSVPTHEGLTHWSQVSGFDFKNEIGGEAHWCRKCLHIIKSSQKFSLDEESNLRILQHQNNGYVGRDSNCEDKKVEKYWMQIFSLNFFS